MKPPRDWDDVNGTAHITPYTPAPTLTGTDDQARTLSLVARYVEAMASTTDSAMDAGLALQEHLDRLVMARIEKMEQGK